jgi:ATP-binding cassette subfamily B protein
MAHEAFHEEEYTGGVRLSIWGKLLRHARPYRGHVVGMVIVAATMSACDNLFPFISRQIIDGATGQGEAVPLWQSAVAYVGLAAVMSVSIWIFIRLAGRIATGLSHDIRRAAFEKLQQLSFSYYDRRPVGWLVARLTADSDRLARIIAWGSLDLLVGFWIVTLAAVFMFSVDWQLALLVMCLVPPLALASVYFKRRLLASQREIRKLNSRITAAYNEGIAGIRTTKSLVREDENAAEFADVTGRMFEASRRNAILAALYVPVVITCGNTAVALALCVGGNMVAISAISIGTLVLFLSYGGHMTWPIAEIARVFSDMQAAQAAAERVLDLLETKSEIEDSPEVCQRVRQFDRADRPAGMAIDGYPQAVGEIEFRHVGFAYQQGKSVLADFSLRVAPGQTVALVGPTGGGKTTIVSLLCRFYEPTAGEILLGGVDYRRRSLRWLQSNLGVVLQSPHLFKGTVRENIRYGRLDADDSQVEAVARMVNAHDFILGLDQGYDSEVGEAGSRLSRGQQQLIALARAVLADPQVMIMDEATSSVDTETERLIQAGVERVLRGRTSFVIAHRLSTIRSADRILVIDGGRIVEEGSHRQLIALRGRYYELYTNQFTHEHEEAILQQASQAAPGSKEAPAQ